MEKAAQKAAMQKKLKEDETEDYTHADEREDRPKADEGAPQMSRDNRKH